MNLISPITLRFQMFSTSENIGLLPLLTITLKNE